MRRWTLLLPAPAQLAAAAGGRRFPALERVIARGAAIAPAPGDDPVLSHLMDVRPGPWPIAAMTRALDAGDVDTALWLRADPAEIAADMGSARLLGVGRLGLDSSACAAIRTTLAPLFGDEGFEFSTPHPERWYLRALGGARLPRFTPPGVALGEDLRAHLPSGDNAARWVRLLNESQVLLHQHPVNTRRLAAGLRPVNSLWFWGPGKVPDRCSVSGDAIASEDSVMLAAALAARLPRLPLQREALAAHANPIADLRRIDDPTALERDWIAPALRDLDRGKVSELLLLFADGSGRRLERGQRWRFWQRPRPL